MGIKLTDTEIFDEWDHQRNTLDPEILFANSYHKAWWICRKDSRHVWQAGIENRAIRGNGCSVCTNRTVISGVNDLVTKNPELAKEWHPSLNEDLVPNRVGTGSNKKVWWICKQNHPYEASTSERSKGKGLCPYCIGDKGMPGDCNIEFLYPDVFQQWDFDKNTISPEFMNPRSATVAWWICPRGHSYDLAINSRCGKGLSCPYCSNNRVLSGFNDLLSQYPAVCKEWDYDKNAILPSAVAKSSNSIVWWRCPEGHSWDMKVEKRTRRGQGCPFCSGQRVLAEFNSLQVVYPDISSQWDHSKNKIAPSEITIGTRKKFWWKCEQDHSYFMSVVVRTGKRNGNCFYCSGQRILVGFNDLETKHWELLKEWDFELNDKSPREVSAGSEYRAFWRCIENHSWQTSVYNRTKATDPTGCIKCAETSTSKIQQAFHKAIAVKIPDLQCDVRIPVPFKSRKSMSVDMISIASNVVIEYDGEYYHSGQRSGKGLQYHLDHDSAKTQALFDAGYKAVRIRENGLKLLDMNHERLMQISYKNGDLMDNVVDAIGVHLGGTGNS